MEMCSLCSLFKLLKYCNISLAKKFIACYKLAMDETAHNFSFTYYPCAMSQGTGGVPISISETWTAA